MSSLKYMREEWAEENIVYYFEINDVGTALRQITVSPERIIVSNRPFGEEHFYLSDQDVPFIPELEIRREVFEALWTQGIEPFQADWQRMREQYLPAKLLKAYSKSSTRRGLLLELTKPFMAWRIIGKREKHPDQTAFILIV